MGCGMGAGARIEEGAGASGGSPRGGTVWSDDPHTMLGAAMRTDVPSRRSVQLKHWKACQRPRRPYVLLAQDVRR